MTAVTVGMKGAEVSSEYQDDWRYENEISKSFCSDDAGRMRFFGRLQRL